MGIATMVVTPSEAVRKQAIERFRLRPERVAAVPEAAAPWLRPVETAPETPYFLFLGTLEPRKNLPALVEAWQGLRRRHKIDLLLAGRRRTDCRPAPPRRDSRRGTLQAVQRCAGFRLSVAL
jgi:glycosyltransferase involved in cell wall biosynthesis